MMVLSNNSSFFTHTRRHPLNLLKIAILLCIFFVTTSSALAVDEQDANIPASSPQAPQVSSKTFFNPEVWYSSVNGVFTWDVPSDVRVVAVEIATSSNNEPFTIADTPVGEFVVTEENVGDGIQYLSIQFKNQAGWGEIVNRKIKIDTTPPEKFEITVQTGTAASSFPLLAFEAEDVTSGIEKYVVVIADRKPVVVSPTEARFGYLLKELEDGVYSVKVTAFDKAGNKTESSIPVLITAGWTKSSDMPQSSMSFWSFLVGANIVIGFLVLIVALLFSYLLHLRKQYRIQEEKLREETIEIQDQVQKIFSALRDEIYDQINNISKRPRLSVKEKKAVDGLNQALEVSKTLLEKEIKSI